MKRTVQMAQYFIYPVKSIYLLFLSSLIYYWSVHTYMVYMYSDLNIQSTCRLLWKQLVTFHFVAVHEIVLFV